MRKIAGQQAPRISAPTTPGKTERLPGSPEASAPDKSANPAPPANDLYAGQVGPGEAPASPAGSEVPPQSEDAVSTGATTPDGKPAATGEPLSSELRKLARALDRVSAEVARQGDPQLTEEIKAKVEDVLAHAPQAEKLLAERRQVRTQQSGGSVGALDAEIDALIGETTATAKKSMGEKKHGGAQEKHHRGVGHVTVPNAGAMVMTGSPQEKQLLQQQDAARAAESADGDTKDDASIDDIIRGQKSTPMDPSDPLAAFYVPPEEVAQSRAFACEPFASFTWNLIEHKSQQILELEQPLKAARKEIKQITNELAEAREVLSDAKDQLKAAKELGTSSPECLAALDQVKAAKEVVETLDAKLDTATEKAEDIESRIQTYAKTQSILMEVFKMFIDFLMQDIYRRKFG